jgi:type IV pilus assembly protein PilN
MRVDGQNTRNQFLNNEIQILDTRIVKIRNLNEKKKELQKRTGVVEQLQRSRNVGTQVFDEIAKIVPNGVYLTSLEKQGNSINIIGKSESNNHLANMIREIERSLLFTDAILESITTNSTQSKLLSDFKMRVRIKGLVNEGEDGQVQKNGGKS